MQSSASVRMMNTAPTHLVALASLASMVRGLALGHIGIGNAADGAGQALALAGLEQHDENENQRCQQLHDGNEQST